MTPQHVIDAFASVGITIFNVGISGDELHVDTRQSLFELAKGMEALAVECSEVKCIDDYVRGYFYPPSLKGWS